MKKLNAAVLAAIVAVSLSAVPAEAGDKQHCKKSEHAHCKTKNEHCKMTKEECAKDKQCEKQDHSKCEKPADAKSSR